MTACCAAEFFPLATFFPQLESVAPISRCHYYFTFGYIYSRFRVTEILLQCFIILVSDFCYFPKLSICIEMPVFLSFDLSTICQNLVCQFELSMLDVFKETLGEIYLDMMGVLFLWSNHFLYLDTIIGKFRLFSTVYFAYLWSIWLVKVMLLTMWLLRK